MLFIFRSMKLYHIFTVKHDTCQHFPRVLEVCVLWHERSNSLFDVNHTIVWEPGQLSQSSDYTMGLRTEALWYDSWPEQEFCCPKHQDQPQGFLSLLFEYQGLLSPGVKQLGFGPCVNRMMRLGMMEPYLHCPYLLKLYSRKYLRLHNTWIFHTEFYSAGWERVVFSDKADSCVVGSIALVSLPLPTRFCYEPGSMQTYFIVKIVYVRQSS